MKICGTLLRCAVLCTTVSFDAAAAHAAGVVADCQNFGTVGMVGMLADAIDGSCVMTFNCVSGSGTIIVPQMNVTGASLTIDASTSATSITLDANGSNRHFLVDNDHTLSTFENHSVTITSGGRRRQRHERIDAVDRRPAVAGGANPTSFTVAASHHAIPTLPDDGRVPLMIVLAGRGLTVLRRLT